MKLKYNIGEEVFVLADKKIVTNCPFCDGKGYKIISEGKKVFCQNCDDGVLVSSGDKQYTKGIITGFNYQVKQLTEHDEDELLDDFTEIKDNLGIIEEYYVEVDNSKYFGYGTYDRNKIKRSL